MWIHKKEPWEWWLIIGFNLVCIAVLVGAYYSYARDHWELSVSMEIAHAPERVFDILSSPEGRVKWQYGVTTITTLVGKPGQVGSTGFVFMRTGRKSWQMIETVLAYDRPSHWQVQQESDDHVVAIAVRIEPSAAGCRVFWNETHSFSNPWERVRAFFLVRTHKTYVIRGLEQIALILADERPA